MKPILLFAGLFFSCGIADRNYLRVGGEGRAEWKQQEISLSEKATRFEKQIERFVSPIGTLIYSQPTDQPFRYAGFGDVCDWTGVYLASQSLRYRVTKEKEAFQRVDQLLSGLETLHEITGVRGLFARNAIPPEGPGVPVGEGGVWFDGTGKYANWRWKGDVSRDQYSGALCGLTLAWKYSDSKTIRERVALLACAIVDHLLANDFLLTDPDGRETTHGNLRASIYGVPVGVNALISLLALKLAAESSGEEKYRLAYEKKIREAWGEKTYWAKFQVFGLTNHNNDNMSFLCYYPLLLLEKNREIRLQFLNSLRRSWFYVYREGNSFFNFVAAAFGVADELGIEEAILTLQLYPLDRRGFGYDHRNDPRFEHAFFSSRKGRLRAEYPIPINWRSPDSFLWKGEPDELEGATGEIGESEYPSNDYLLAYWIGKENGFLP